LAPAHLLTQTVYPSRRVAQQATRDLSAFSQSTLIWNATGLFTAPRAKNLDCQTCALAPGQLPAQCCLPRASSEYSCYLIPAT